MNHNPLGTMLDFPLASGRRTYISIHELKFPELSPQFLCNNNSYTGLWKQHPLYSSLMPQSKWTLKYTVLYFNIYRHNIHILTIVQWPIVTTMRKSILSTLCFLVPPKALSCSGKVSAISRSVLAQVPWQEWQPLPWHRAHSHLQTWRIVLSWSYALPTKIPHNYKQRSYIHHEN